MALTLNSTTGISGVDGSASAPALQGSDSNTGFSFGTDTVNINTGGSTRATIDSSGQIGIGKTPSRTLDVAGKIRSSEAVCFGNNSSTPSEGAAIYRPAASTMAFVTNDVERFRINSTGTSYFLTDAGTGCTVMQSSLSAGTTYNLFQAQHSVSSIGSNGTQCWFITTNGNTYNTNNTYGSASDINLKENIVDAKSQWNDIKALKIRNFNFKNDSEKVKMLGVVAQEVEAAGMTGLVDEHPDTDADGKDLKTVTKSVKYSILYMKAIKALQEAQARIETLETKVAALEAG